MEEDGTEWLPVVELDGVEYVVDIANRAFRQRCDRDISVGFYSEQGREMVRAMAGMEWGMWTPREVWKAQRELVV